MDPFRSIFAPGGYQGRWRGAARGHEQRRRYAYGATCARLCHELIGPITAIQQWWELLADEDLDFADDTVELDRRRRASRRSFALIASPTDFLAAPSAHSRGSRRTSFGGSRITCEYVRAPRSCLLSGKGWLATCCWLQPMRCPAGAVWSWLPLFWRSRPSAKPHLSRPRRWQR
jgi:hypothetical protein